MSPRSRLSVLNVGFTRYQVPLSRQTEKKFRILSELGDWTVLGLAADGRAGQGRRDAPVRLYRLPLVPLAGLRFAMMFFATLGLGFRLGRVGKARLLLFEGPYEALAGVILSRVLRWSGTRVVVACEIHGDWEESPFLYRRVPLSFLARPFLSAWARFVLKRMDLLRTVADSFRDRLRSVAPDTRSLVFPTFTDLDLFLEPLPHVRSTAPGRILYVGALSPLKGLTYLIEAVGVLERAHPELELRLVGEGVERKRLEAELKRRGLTSVNLRGALSPEEVREELEAARLLVLPSLSEGLPRVILEALASGVPVVATRTGSVSEVVQDGETGFLVPPRDSGALAEKIAWILDHPDAAREMGRRGRAFVEQRFSVARYREGYRELLSEAASLLDGAGAGETDAREGSEAPYR